MQSSDRIHPAPGSTGHADECDAGHADAGAAQTLPDGPDQGRFGAPEERRRPLPRALHHEQHGAAYAGTPEKPARVCATTRRSASAAERAAHRHGAAATGAAGRCGR